MPTPHPHSPLTARQRALEALSMGESLRSQIASHAASSQQSAVAHHSAATERLSALASRAESAATPDEKQGAQREYLQAVSDQTRSEQAFQLARRQQLQCGDVLTK